MEKNLKLLRKDPKSLRGACILFEVFVLGHFFLKNVRFISEITKLKNENRKKCYCLPTKTFYDTFFSQKVHKGI
jgi:hypothetical protein